MKKCSFIIFCSLAILNSCNSKQENTNKSVTEKNKKTYEGKLKLDGIYTGKNLYVQNPVAESGKLCVVSKPVVNGNVSTALIHSSVLEIDLKSYKFKVGDSVHILIEHDDNCLPEVLNPEAIGLGKDSTAKK